MKNNTLDKKEIEKFSKIAEEWWNPTGKFKPLHKFNPVRIKYIKDYLINDLDIKKKNKPLKGSLSFLILNSDKIVSLMYFILMGLNLCNGLNFPLGSHHSSAIFENFSISFLFIVLFFIVY